MPSLALVLPRTLALVFSVLGFMALWPAGTASAQEAPFPRVTTNAPVQLLVDGLEASALPAAVLPGSQVCVAATLHYAGVTDRWLFQGWELAGAAAGTTLSRESCIRPSAPGLYRARYAREVLFTTPSPIKALRKTAWVPYGPPYEVQVPAEVMEGERVRYKFKDWSSGESPYLAANRIAVLAPTTLEANWTKEYLVRVTGPQGVTVPGSDWYAEEGSLVLQAQETVPLPGGRERLKFARWESVGLPPAAIPDPEKTSTLVKVEGPYTIRAAYDSEFLVVISNPGGTLLRKWLKQGEEIDVESPPIIETIPGREQLVFRRWEGAEGVTSPVIKGIIEGALDLRAAYDRQVMVTVVTPYGPAAGAGFQKAGNTVTVGVPGSLQSRLVFRRTFEGFVGQAQGRNGVQLLVQEPLTITATYRNEVNMPVLALLVVVPLTAISLWLLGRRFMPERGPSVRRPFGRRGATGARDDEGKR